MLQLMVSTIDDLAQSSQPGRGLLATSDNSELNRLTDQADGLICTPVTLTTLDVSSQEMGWPRIDLVKIDAEGHETSVIEGGWHFFETQSPLVMCEIKAKDKFDLSPLQRMESIGYSTYRLVPGLNALVPFNHGEPIDDFQLNLFCCKSDRARQLELDGCLISAVVTELPDLEGDDWIGLVEKYPYGRQFAGIWKKQIAAKPIQEWTVYRRALNAYVRAHSAGEKLSTRYACLLFAYRELASLLDRAGNHPRLLTFARVAADLGHRQRAVDALERMLEMMHGGEKFFAGEPFLPVSPDLEQIDPGANFANWVAASVLERYVSLGSFSGYFFPDSTSVFVPAMANFGFTTPAMKRRLSLVRQRATLVSGS